MQPTSVGSFLRNVLSTARNRDLPAKNRRRFHLDEVFRREWFLLRIGLHNIVRNILNLETKVKRKLIANTSLS